MTPQPTHGEALLVSPVRRSIVAALAAEAPGLDAEHTAAALAEAVGLHVTTVRFHLDRLVAAGLVTTGVRRRAGAGRPRKVYSLVPVTAGDERTEVESLRLLSGLLVEALTVGDEGRRLTPHEAGRRWALEHVPVAADDRPAESAGRWLAKLGQMVEVLEEWGYTPEVSTRDGGRTADITLSHCPFLDLARANQAVVCGIHRGLIAGSLERLGERGVHVSLDPLVDPVTCLAHVTTATPFRTHATKEPA